MKKYTLKKSLFKDAPEPETPSHFRIDYRNQLNPA